MTWEQFKKLVEDAGVKDRDIVYYLDTGNYPEADKLDVTKINNEFLVRN